MNDSALRQSLIELLQGESAHATVKHAIESLNPSILNVRPGENGHSVWELFEHMRITQEDILRYTLDKNWKSPGWPEGHWPHDEGNISDDKWNKSVTAFFRDLDDIIRLVKNKEIDLTSEIPHGEGRTYLREVLLIADHNAYHAGQIIIVRKLLGSWQA